MLNITLRPGRGTLALAAGVVLMAGVADAQDLPGAGRTVQPIKSSIAEELFQYKVLMKGLERLGYTVEEPLESEYATAHIAVANGDAHFTAAHWESLQKAFYERAGGDDTQVKLGVLTPNLVQGYLIDKATAEAHGVTSIDQFQNPEIAKLFDSDGDGRADLTGCNPGWGCERTIEHHLDAYELRDTVEHNQGSYFALIANTIARYERGESIFYYTWTPLWLGNVLVPGEDVVWQEVPFTSLPDGVEGVETALPDGTNVGFPLDRMMVVANREWAEENPAAARFLELAEISVADISAQNLKMRNGEDSPEDIDRHAEEWIAANADTFNRWIEEAMKAASS